MNSGRHATGVASDGQIFFALSDSASRRSGDVIYRVSPRGGAPERVLEGLAWPWLAVSADGRRIAHVAPLDAAPHRELLAVTDLPTGRRFTVATRESSRGAILGLSPDGRYLVHTIDYTSDPDSVGAWLVSLEDGVARRIVALSPAAREGPSRIVGGLRWVGEAPHLLLIEATAARSRLALTVVDGARGTRRLIGTVLAGERQPVGTAWSPDGNRVAIWLPIAIGPEACVPGGVCITRRLVHFRLYLFDARTGSTRMLAERVGTEGPRWLEFSPDGRWLAYSLFGDIRVHRL